MRNYAVTIMMLSLFLVGCRTTSASRQEAAQTRQIVEKFRVRQQSQLDNLNNEYRQEFSDLINQMTKLTWVQTEQGFDRESLLLADKLASDWKGQTAPSAISGDFLGMVQGDTTNLLNAEAGLDNLRKAYNDQFTNAVAQLNLLKQIEANLDSVSQEPSQWNDTQTALAMLYQAYRTNQPTSNVVSNGVSGTSK